MTTPTPRPHWHPSHAVRPLSAEAQTAADAALAEQATAVQVQSDDVWHERDKRMSAMAPTPEEVAWWQRAFANPSTVITVDAETFDKLQAMIDDPTPDPAPKLHELFSRPSLFSQE